ncbi:protein strawberry notch-like [Cimex lectularius]|uniref:Strawberry notch n=1 Tax=Cimex lectularius TaxID=79782 RepID=A0A8I6RGC7_CIMLE|nr:protein strawberry notch-like [Cimex lectularius]
MYGEEKMESSDSDFEDPDKLEVPGGGRDLAALSTARKSAVTFQSTNSHLPKRYDNLFEDFVMRGKNSSTILDNIQFLKSHNGIYTDLLGSRSSGMGGPYGLQFEGSQMQKSFPWKDSLSTEQIKHNLTNVEETTEDEGMGVAETYADYMPSKLNFGRKHPDPVVESTSLSSVEPVDVWYKLKIPESVISSGSLSALQLESITYACQQHELLLPNGARGGFLIGDGAGVGKGRTIAGIIYENYLRSRKKSIWISIMNDLKYDSERDLSDIGADNIKVFHLNKCKYTKLNSEENGLIKKGVIFCTYSALIAKTTTQDCEFENRFDQIVDWCGPNFDGVIIFDECHRAKNLCPGGSGKPTKTGLTVLELQKRLPKARVVYASATGASEPRNMAYMVRLGMWGQGTAYADFNHFLNTVQKRGVGAMEIVAMDMKLRGLYIARQLSFHGVVFKIVEIPIDPAFIKIYDEAVELWVEVFKGFRHAASLFDADKSVCVAMWSQFWSAHQRFFKYMCISAKVKHAVNISREAIKCGKCVVIGLQSTGEARTLNQLEKDDGELTDFVSTARGVLRTLVEKHFPAPDRNSVKRIIGNDIAKTEISRSKRKKRRKQSPDLLNLKTSDNFDSLSEEEVDDKNYDDKCRTSGVKTDDFSLSGDNLIQTTVFQKKQLLAKIDILGKKLPPNTLDELIDELGGPENVAEMTGRKGRVVHNDGSYKYETRSEVDIPLEVLNLREKKRFMDGSKDVAIISEAASSGISLHSDRRALNRKRRVHLTLELPWSADRAIQQFGRTHRSNQTNAPEYVLLISNLGGERRFASIVAKRLESLGALTQGDRRATEARDMSKFNIDNNYGRMAVELTLKTLVGQENPLVPPPTSYEGDFFKDAIKGLIGVGLVLQSENNPESLQLDHDRKCLGRFLNRILGLPVNLQNALFEYFTNTMEAIIESAKKSGHFDLGILDVAAQDENTKRLAVYKFFRKQLTGMTVTELHKVRVERGMTWAEAVSLWTELKTVHEGFYLSSQVRNGNNEVILVQLENGISSIKKSFVKEQESYCIHRPNVGLQLKRENLKFILKKFKKIGLEEAEHHWKSHYSASSSICSHSYWTGICKKSCFEGECDVGLRHRTYNILSGSVLSLWNSIENIVSTSSGSARLQVVRVKTSEGDKIVGTLIPSNSFQKLYDELTAVSERVEKQVFS